MTTLKFLRALADELGCSVEQLDDEATEYVLEVVNTNDIARAARDYRGYIEDGVQP